MRWRIQRRIELMPGVVLNLSRSGSSWAWRRLKPRLSLNSSGIQDLVSIPQTNFTSNFFCDKGSYRVSTLVASFTKSDIYLYQAVTPPEPNSVISGFSWLILSPSKIKFLNGTL